VVLTERARNWFRCGGSYVAAAIASKNGIEIKSDNVENRSLIQLVSDKSAPFASLPHRVTIATEVATITTVQASTAA
jgi:hypothetical protein